MSAQKASVSSTVEMDDNSSPKTIAFPLVGNTIGGSHQSMLGLLRNLDLDRYRPIVIHEASADRIASHFADFRTEIAPSIEVDERPGQPVSVKRALLATRHSFAQRKLLRRLGADLVHTNDGRTHAAWGLAARITGLPLLWHHRADPDGRGLNRIAPILANRIVSVSRFALPADPNSPVHRKASVVHSPFDTSLAPDRQVNKERLREELGISPSTVICGYFGLLIDRKRPTAFVEAIAALKELSPRPVAGVIFGEPAEEGIEARVEQRIAELDLENEVRLLGFRTPGHDWIAACDFLLVPAVREPLGRTLVEAAVVGTPVVATRSGGNPEALIDDTGILVEPDDPLAMAKAVVDALDHPECIADMTARARISASRRFGMKEHASSIMRIYDDLLHDGEQR